MSKGEIMENSKNKKTLGIVLSVFFGVLGLIIGLCAYPYNSEERKTFVSGWLTGLVIYLSIIAVIVLIVVISAAALY